MKKQKLDTAVQHYIVNQTQVTIDNQMVPCDIWATMAHVIMLCQCHIVPLKKTAQILSALISIQHEYDAGRFQIDPQQGAQLTLETKVVEKIGDMGLAMHTARSRNDQVMVTEMLYLKHEILTTMYLISAVIKTLIALSKKYSNTVMPGYTHMQPAKPTTFAAWCLAYSDAFAMAMTSLQHVYIQYDKNPLGSVESYGTSWPIDRITTSQLLDFSSVWEIPQDAISSRGFFQMSIIAGLQHIATVASKIATDLLLFSTFEYGMVSFGDAVAQRLHPITGSSVMAQKKNPDVLELIRATAPQITGFYQIIAGLLSKLPMGYNRDVREVKEYVGLGLEKTNTALIVLNKVLTTLDINRKRMTQLVDQNYSMTTDVADYLSQQADVSYRLVYKIVGQAVDMAITNGKLLHEVSMQDINVIAKSYNISFSCSDTQLQDVLNPKKALAKRKHIGGTNTDIAKALIAKRGKELKAMKQWVIDKEKSLAHAKKKTWNTALYLIKKGSHED